MFERGNLLQAELGPQKEPRRAAIRRTRYPTDSIPVSDFSRARANRLRRAALSPEQIGNGDDADRGRHPRLRSGYDWGTIGFHFRFFRSDPSIARGRINLVQRRRGFRQRRYF